ncbi:hypothetical protein [Desulfofarcimen acetoxidans]|jgi:hypothetical protein|uniref:hypothetical protein n=1 Tax=Desulfofarcimen acetoxidans TaxID=58138 RepID=UPI00019E4D11|nr:hypothetical protein [Desulfofarcimen acetoxidans]
MLECKKCGIAEETGEDMIFCHKYRTAINTKVKSFRQECIFFTSRIVEGGELLSPQEHLYLKEAEQASIARKTVSLPNRRRFIAKNFATYSGSEMKNGSF